MNNIFSKKLFSLLALLAGLFASCSGSSKKVDSHWNDSTVVIDGKINDWLTATTYDKENKISYGIQNDSNYLYILFRPTRQMLQQAMMFGFTLWFDAEGGNNKRLGIRYPIGMINYTQGNFSPMEIGGEFSDILKHRLSETLQEFDILYPEADDKFRFSKYLRCGIDIALNDSLEEAVYEIKIPFHKIDALDIPLNISSLSNPIGIGMELGKFDREKMKEPFAGRGGEEGKIPDGGMGGAGRRGGGRAGPGGGMAQQNITLNAWFTVQLSSGLF